MREFAFDIVYETGADPVMDVFIEYPTLVAEALHGCVTEDRFWRVERLTGPTAALDAIERLRLDETVRTASVTETDCTATRTHDVLERSDDERVIYTYLEGVEDGDAIQTLSAQYLPPGRSSVPLGGGLVTAGASSCSRTRELGCSTTP